MEILCSALAGLGPVQISSGAGTPAKLYISVRRKVYWNIQVSPRCHSLSIFVYVIFTMSKIVLRNVYVCLNVYLCPRLSIIVYNCL